MVKPGSYHGVTCGHAPPVYPQLLDLGSMLVAYIQLPHNQVRRQESPLGETGCSRALVNPIPHMLDRTKIGFPGIFVHDFQFKVNSGDMVWVTRNMTQGEGANWCRHLKIWINRASPKPSQ